MSRELVLDVVAKKNSRQLAQLADEFDKLARATDDAGRRMHKTGTFAQFLDDEIAKTKDAVRDLGREFDRTGDKDVFGKLRGSQTNLRELERIRKDLADALSGGARDASPGVAARLRAAVAAGLANPAMGGFLPAIAASVAAGAPLIGAATSAAVLGGIGAAGIGAAVAVQLSDPIVKDASTLLGANALDGLTKATASFQPVLLGAIDEADAALSRLWPKLQKGFDRLAPSAGRLADGLIRAGESAMPGVLHSLTAAGPVLDELARDAPKLGQAMSSFFDDVAAGGPGAVAFMHDFTSATGDGIQTLGTLVEGLSKAYKFLHDWHLISLTPSDLWTKESDGAQKTAGALDKVATSGQYAATSIQYVEHSLAGLIAQELAADNATLQYNQSVLGLADSLKENGRHWEDNTKAGLANQSALLQGVGAAKAKMEADITAGKSAAEAARQYNAEVDRLLAMAGAAGLAKKELDKLKGEYKVTISENFVSRKSGTAGATGRIAGARAGGGPVTAGKTYVVGEHRAELFVPDTNGHIIPEVPAPGRGAPWPGAGTPMSTLVTFAAAPGDQLAAFLLSLLRPVVSRNYGGNVQAALGGAR